MINDAYQESVNFQKLAQVSRSLGVSKKNVTGGNLQNAFLANPIGTI
ncbi:MAG: hypothetical protein ACI8YC_001365 [Salibacteraceae bacterium]